MAGETCSPDILSCFQRFARLDASGATPAGATNSIVTNQLMECNYEEEVQAGTEISAMSACGSYAWPPYQTPDAVKWGKVTLTTAVPIHELIEMLTGAALITASGATVGHARPALGVRPFGPGVSIELWSMRLVNGFQAATRPWIWHVLTRVYNIREGPRKWFNGAYTPTFTGIACENSGWGNGPNNDWPGPSDRVLASMETTISPPTVSCGYVTVPAQV